MDPDGAYLFIKLILKENFDADNSEKKMKHILGWYAVVVLDYYELCRELEDSLVNDP